MIGGERPRAVVDAARWLTGLAAQGALGVGRARRVFTRPRVRVALEAASGTVLIALGLRVATQP